MLVITYFSLIRVMQIIFGKLYCNIGTVSVEALETSSYLQGIVLTPYAKQ